MAKEAASRNGRFAADCVSWQRYGHDLAYMMKRLDKMDEIIREQERLISQLVLQFCDLRDGNRPKVKPRVETRGTCRIIQFRQG